MLLKCETGIPRVFTSSNQFQLPVTSSSNQLPVPVFSPQYSVFSPQYSVFSRALCR